MKRGVAQFVVALIGACALAFAASGETPSVDIEGTRSALESWVETERLLSEERRDLVLARELLNERILLMEREVASFREKIDDASQSITEADKKRQELLADNQALEAAAASLVPVLVSLEQRTRNLLKRSPDPIRERVKPLSQRIPQATEETRLSLSERFQNVIGILNEVNKFDREVTVSSEVRTLEDGTSAEVSAVYLGLGVGYYTGANGTVGGVGTGSEGEWVWTPRNHAAAEIAQIADILKNEAIAAFVPVPIEIK